mmetsp:Transcript_7012/g.8082  ORF Transcript_7012/g.8082 Transcript_7012/m.8082 type:complete len:272 (+) Transcript_7012:79-894(+)
MARLRSLTPWIFIFLLTIEASLGTEVNADVLETLEIVRVASADQTDERNVIISPPGSSLSLTHAPTTSSSMRNLSPSVPAVTLATETPTFSPTASSIISTTKAPTLAPTASAITPTTNTSSFAPTATAITPTTKTPTFAPTATAIAPTTKAPTFAPTKSAIPPTTKTPTFAPTELGTNKPTYSPTQKPIVQVQVTDADRGFVILTLSCTAIIILCVCTRGMRRRRGRQYQPFSQSDTYHIDGGGIEFRDRSHSDLDLLRPIDVSSRDLDVI